MPIKTGAEYSVKLPAKSKIDVAIITTTTGDRSSAKVTPENYDENLTLNLHRVIHSYG